MLQSISSEGASAIAFQRHQLVAVHHVAVDRAIDEDRVIIGRDPLSQAGRVLPCQVDSNDMKMWTDQAFGPEQWLAYAIRNFDQVYREGMEGNPKMMSLGLHLRIIGRPGRIWALEAFLRHVRKHDRVWVATRHQIAQHLAAVDPA